MTKYAIVIVNSKVLKCNSKAKRMAPAYSRMQCHIRRVVKRSMSIGGVSSVAIETREEAE